MCTSVTSLTTDVEDNDEANSFADDSYTSASEGTTLTTVTEAVKTTIQVAGSLKSDYSLNLSLESLKDSRPGSVSYLIFLFHK